MWHKTIRKRSFLTRERWIRTVVFIGFIATFWATTTIGLILEVARAILGGAFYLLWQQLISLLPTILNNGLSLVMISVFGTARPLVVIFITLYTNSKHIEKCAARYDNSNEECRVCTMIQR